MRTHWVMDYETLSNCFVAVFQDIKSDDTRVFVVHDLQNDIDSLLEFFDRNINYDEWHVSFNGLGFDAQITEYILRAGDSLRDMGGCEIAEYLYDKAQSVITRQNMGEFLEFAPWNLNINQVDVFKLNHWDNAAKRSSLKWIQYSMDWENIKDMPIHHSTEINTLDQIDMICDYCINDVESTKRIMQLSKKQIALRKSLTEEYDIPLFSASEPKIAKELFMYFLSKKTGIKKRELKDLRTLRSTIICADLINDYIDFKTATFQRLQKKFAEQVLDPMNLKGSFTYSLRYHGVQTDFGLGGVHGAIDKGVYESDEDNVIMSSDVTSFYPNLAIRNGWSPAHLPTAEFCEQYEWFFDERRKIPKSDPRNYVYKIILNSTYGLSNEQNSFLYDPELTMRITINGQLSLMMLYEMIMENIPGARPMLQNTDGLETMIPRTYIDKYMQICKEWEKITNLELEHDTYRKLIVADVNNYIAVYDYKEVKKEDYDVLKKELPHNLYKEEDGKYYMAGTKCKGMRFEFHDVPLHKNKSFLVIRKALFYHFVHDQDPVEYIKNHKEIFDFCGGKRIRGEWEFEKMYVDGDVKTEPVQETIRYYISNKGCKIIKRNKIDGREQQIQAGPWLQTLFIKYEEKPFEEYDINYDFYITKMRKELNALEQSINQLSLF
jgi:hypothetical protein